MSPHITLEVILTPQINSIGYLRYSQAEGVSTKKEEVVR